jgi:L-threonylcarbamoyladenylate synthase
MIDTGVIQEAARVLKGGGLVIMPTDTVYGLAADPGNPAAVRKLYAAKGRDSGKPIALLAAEVSDVRRFAPSLTPAEQALAQRWWPGPLTLVLETPSGPEGFRVPDCRPARELIRQAGGILRVTSANLSGDPPALTAEQAREALEASVDFVVDGGPIQGGQPSTVVKVEDRAPRILRAGALDMDQLQAALRGKT